ncbi:hypothetical protein DERP_000111 [Dermatophagoides pteronyssinus]|uniref:Uncharacterized protein n=1 Tax=Dermatophagoides pteronyssinus TaxID=6956 RepID=A0ABQ8IZB6_DERPT|nr:hypothetical protein DERP_000111 [Dermatophagoides pteronyssinus]
MSWKNLIPVKYNSNFRKNCNPDSAESIPPVARIVNSGTARATAETARNAIGLVALPDIPP